MAADLPVKAIYVDLKLDGVNWTNVTADVRAQDHIRIRYGVFGHTPNDRTASAGTCTFTLDDSAKNSGSLLGYYSPGHANKRTGFELNVPARVRIAVGFYYSEKTYNDFIYGTAWVKFVGKVKDIKVVAGLKGTRKTVCTAYDFIHEMSLHKMDLLGQQASQRSDQVITAIVGNMAVAPTTASYSTGQETFTSSADDLKDERTTALAAAHKVTMSEFGYFYSKGNDTTGDELKFEDRHDRISSTSVFTLTESEIVLVEGDRSIDLVYNVVEATAYPRQVGASAEVLFTLQKALEIPGSTTRVIMGRYTDPNERSSRMSGKAVITPVVSTDYKFGSSESVGVEDKNADLTVTVTKGANATEFTLQNTSGVTGYVNLLQIRGTAIRIYEPVVHTAENAASKTSYGVRELQLNLPYQESVLKAKDFADTTLAAFKSPQTVLPRVSIIGKKGLKARSATKLEPGDRITITETVLGITAADYFVHGVEMELIPPDILQASWSVKVASAEQSWLLGSTGFSELGTTTILGV